MDTAPERLQPLAHLRILLVEDELDIADLLLFILNEAGAEVRLSTHAREALEAVEQFQPDLLLCNVRLPDHDATWVIEHIQARNSEPPPAIAITSYLREIAAHTMLEAGFQHFLKKPIDPDELIVEVLHLTQRDVHG